MSLLSRPARTHVRGTLLCLCLIFAVAPAAAHAAAGGLTPLASPTGCLSQTGTAGACGDGRALSAPVDVAASSDGKQVYSASTEGVAVATRDPRSGALAQAGGTAGCITENGTGGQCGNGTALSGANDLALSPDGKNLYVAAQTSNAVVVLARNATSGALTQLAGTAGCVSQGGTGGACADGRALTSARSVAVSPDGRFVYVGSRDGSTNSIAVFARNTSTGALLQLGATAGCLSEAASADGCAVAPHLGAADLAIAPNGGALYAAAGADDTVATLTRNVSTGALTVPAGVAACISETGTGGDCRDGRALDAPVGLAVSPDSRTVYAASRNSDALAVLPTDPSGGLGQSAATTGCVSETGAGPCVDGSGLNGASSVALTRAGDFAYVASSVSDAVSALALSGGAALPVGCISQTGSSGACATGPALNGANGVAVTSDSRSVYAAASVSQAISGAARTVASPPAGQAAGDFNGDGRTDLALGVPGEAIGSTRAGGVSVLMASASGFGAKGQERLIHQNTPGIPGVNERGDEFGGAVAAGDFNGDGFDDLAIGAPGENTGRGVDAGAIVVIPGSPTGLNTAKARLIGVSGGGSHARLGGALAVGDVDGDHRADLAAGAAGFSDGRGRVLLFRGTSTALADGGQEITQDTPGIQGAAEKGDEFGAAVALADETGDGLADLIVGVPGEDTAGIKDAGGVQLIRGSAAGISAIDRFVTQGSAGVGARSERGDAMGASLAAGNLFGTPAAEIAIGVPGEDIGRHTDAGAAIVLAASGQKGSKLVTQDTPGVPGVPEKGDAFGRALAVADMTGDGYRELAIGAPGEGVGKAFGAGEIHVIRGGASGLAFSGSKGWTQNTPGIPGVAEKGDAFGQAIGTADGNGDGLVDLAVGSPGEKIGSHATAGSVTVVPGSSTLSTSGSTLIYQGHGASGAPEKGDEYADSASQNG